MFPIHNIKFFLKVLNGYSKEENEMKLDHYRLNITTEIEFEIGNLG